MNITKTKDGFKVDVGGLWEETDWEIIVNCRVGAWGQDKPCPHCGEKQSEIKTYEDNSEFTDYFWICPRVVKATNEGGYNTTGVCLDCILEAAEKIKQ